MKLVFSLAICVWILISFTGCADMINSLREESAAVDQEVDRDDEEASDSSYVYRPKNLRGVSANKVNSVEPKVMRGYGRRLSSFEEGAGNAAESAGAIGGGYRRVTKDDFRDTAANENSLWDGQGQENYLFSHNRQRQPGDLVTVDVEKELKREIQYQLWMTLPPEQRKLKRAPASKDGAKPGEEKTAAADKAQDKANEEKAKDAAEEAAKTNLASGGKEDDLVRMEVAENLGNGLVRMVGQKRVIYRGQTRVVEVVSLVNHKDIDDSGRVKSSAFLDMKTQVIQ
jgi:flagellar L-ring protein FlgH